MVKEYTAPERVYEIPFEVLMKAYDLRFPSSDLIPSFLGSQILSEQKSSDGSIHTVQRRCKIAINAPYLLKKIIGTDHAFFIQTNKINWLNRTMHIEAYNECFSTRVGIREICCYKVHPLNDNWTIFEQKAYIELHNFFKFENLIEKFAMNSYASSISKAKEVMPIFISRLKEDHNVQWSVDENKISIFNKQFSEDEPRNSLDESLTSSISLDFSGNLNLQEKNCLILLKNHLETRKEKHDIDDMIILKFLRSCNMNYKRAYRKVLNYLKWRHSNYIDSISTESHINEKLVPFIRVAWHHHDNENRPLVIIKLGEMDLKGLFKSIGPKGFAVLMIKTCEEALKFLKELNEGVEIESQITTISCILDLEGLTMRHAWRPMVRTAIKIIEICQAYYPETLGRLFVVNVPKIFGLLWPILSPIIDDTSKQKIFIYAGDGMSDPNGLTNFIDKEFIPDFLSGPCPVDLPPLKNKLIPKSMYSLDYTVNRENLLNFSMLEEEYKIAQATKSREINVLVKIEEEKNVLTWDFDVIEGSVEFQLLIKNGENEEVLVKNTHSEGASVQASFVCERISNYHLIWNHAEISVVGKPKSTILYFYEVLPSQKYRGSMTSLASSISHMSQLTQFTCNFSQNVDE